MGKYDALFDDAPPVDEPAPVTARTTGYYPQPAGTPNHAMEGGSVDKMGNPLYTIESYLRGNAPYVSVAGDPRIPYGTPVHSPDFPGIKEKVVDTGSAFKNAGASHFDIATETRQMANSPEINRHARYYFGDDPAAAPKGGKYAALFDAPVDQAAAKQAGSDAMEKAAGQTAPPTLLDKIHSALNFISQGKSGAQMDAEEIRKNPEALTSPLLQFPRITTGPDASLREKIEAALGNTGRGFISGATSPLGALALSNPVVGGATLLSQAPQLAQQVQAAERTPAGSQERLEAGLNTVLNLGTLAAGAKGVLRDAPVLPESGASLPETAETQFVPRGSDAIPPEPAPASQETASAPQPTIPTEEAPAQPSPEALAANVEAQQAKLRDWQSRVEAGRREQNINAMAERLYNEALSEAKGPGPKDMQAERLIAMQKRAAQVSTGDRDVLAAFDRAHQMATQLAEAKMGYLLPEDRPSRYVDLEEGQPFAGNGAGTFEAPEDTSIAKTTEDAAKTPAATDVSPADSQESASASTVEEPPAQPATRTSEPAPNSQETVPTGTGVANRAFEQIYGEDAPEPGEGHSREELIAQGRQDVASGKIDPYAVATKVNKGDAISHREIGALRAEHERLHAEAVAAERAGSPDALGRSQLALDFANMFQKAKTMWAESGRSLQGMEPIQDVSSLTGIREIMSRELNRDATPEEIPTLERAAKSVRDVGDLADQALETTANRIIRNPRVKKLMSVDELREDLGSALKDIFRDCFL